MKYSDFLNECIRKENQIRMLSSHRDLIKNYSEVVVFVDEDVLQGDLYMRFFKDEDELKEQLVNEFVVGWCDFSKTNETNIGDITKWINKDAYFDEIKKNYRVFEYSKVDLNKNIDLENDDLIYKNTLDSLESSYQIALEEKDRKVENEMER